MRQQRVQAKVSSALNNGLRFLAGEQEKDGSFMCLVSTKLDDYSQAKTVPAIVPTNIVLSSLIHIESNLSATIKKKAAGFLLGERNEYWSFNYWFKKSNWFKKEPYPDDLDDTFCALSALYEYKPGLFNGEVMAKIVTMLTSAEKQEGGPYDMWLVPEEGRSTWNDTDLVVNSNVAFFLALQDISLPKVNAFIEKSIDEEDYEFPYNKIYPAVYFISRFYKGRKTDRMIKLLLSKQEQNGKWENPLRTSLAISALINLSGHKYQAELEKGIEYLLRNQNRDGGWKPASFYFQMRTSKKTLYAGSASITTALCLEAINKWQNKFKAPKIAVPKKERAVKAAEIYEAASKVVKTRFSTCDSDLRREASKVVAKTLKGDRDKQIVLLPYFFAAALRESSQKIIAKRDFLTNLGAANTFGWIAYTIYDDYFDGESGAKSLALLSVANVALRESSEIFGNILPPRDGLKSAFAEFSKKIFDTIDGANAWEINHCRGEKLPDYGNYAQLAEKSLGHSLGPMAILFALGYRENSAEVQTMMDFFRHYLIARQLNDDAHDWENDLKRGHINAAAIQILKKIKILPGRPSDKQLGELRKLFWADAVVQVCNDILKHAQMARNSVGRSALIKDVSLFENLLAPIEESALKALKEREETIKFVKSYR